MWGNIILETTYLTNFTFGFPNLRSDILLRVSHWQYWWWFWFSYFFVLYYLLIMKLFRTRLLKARPRLVTSFRSHGKWGDVVICLLPLSWCANILTNSNFLLRASEWQAESALFTIRIRGKQWYWVYKFELKTVTDILSTPKNLGHNKWQVNTPGELSQANDYLHILQLRAQNKWVKNYWSSLITKSAKTDKYHVTSPVDMLFLNNAMGLTTNSSAWLNDMSNLSNIPSFEGTTLYSNDSNLFTRLKVKQKFLQPVTNDLTFNEKLVYTSDLFDVTRKQQLAVRDSILLESNNSNNLFNHQDLTEVNRWAKRALGVVSPIRLIKLPINTTTSNSSNLLPDNNFELFRFRYNLENSSIRHKVLPHSVYLNLKQTRYKRKKFISPRVKFIKNEVGVKTKIVKSSSTPFLSNNNIIVNNDFDSTQQYRMLKKNHNYTTDFSNVLNKRLLRVKRTLVLPAHVNITAITNSYDVAHSWFLPGFGLKLDCVPGRATHHTFHIDNVGFYYGQCAEICGRYHHHMPIRVCALPFEHFLVWWNSFGLTKFLSTFPKRRFEGNYAFTKFVW